MKFLRRKYIGHFKYSFGRFNFTKDQENPNFSAFDQFGSLTNNSVFDPGRFGKCPDGMEIVCKARSLKSYHISYISQLLSGVTLPAVENTLSTSTLLGDEVHNQLIIKRLLFSICQSAILLESILASFKISVHPDLSTSILARPGSENHSGSEGWR